VTTTSSTPTVETRYQFFPNAWEPGVARQVFETLVGPDKPYPAQAWGNEGGDLLPTDPAELIDVLTDRYEASHRRNRITLFTDQPFETYNFELFRSEWDDEAKIGQLMFWAKELRVTVPADVVARDDVFQALVQVAEITASPLVAMDYRPERSFKPITLASRAELKRVVQGTVHASASEGLWCGLHRIPWRLILGTDVVRTIGVDRLTALPDGRAVDHGNGLWTLQTSADPAESITDDGRAVEPRHDLLVERFGDKLKPL